MDSGNTLLGKKQSNWDRETWERNVVEKMKGRPTSRTENRTETRKYGKGI